MKDALASFSEFNNSVDGADVKVGGKHSAGFNLHGIDGGLSDLINSNRAGVTLSGSGNGYDQQATTNEFHPLIGMRRWGHTGPFDDSPPAGWKKMSIWTEAYETSNGLNLIAARRGWRMAITMWNQYLNGVAKLVIDKCGGRADPAKVIIEEETAKMKHPWFNR